ncbi:MFS transporter [Anaeromyxobacter paludicola]|uniref:MFS transporter n=1 Tax=Anaeromyxobacter paludicola TaxID=2918171 RepID=A0ABM7XD87_9BACT|nr:MFS transporter [Anaeromyxobacter paludicola]BDG09848.1 MFS transporter [Anaeromyxobacter paludicola]
MTHLRDLLRQRLGGLPRAYWALWAGALVNRLGTFVVPFLALYLTGQRGLPVSTAGAVVSLWGLGAIFSSALGGWLADRVGRRATAMTGLALGGAAVLALGFARGVPAIAAATLAAGFLSELYRPAMQAAVADLVTDPVKRLRAFALMYWAANLGVSFALVVAGYVAKRSYLALFAADAATTLAFAAIVWRFVPETRPQAGAPAAHAADGDGARPGARERGPLADRVFVAFLVQNFLFAFVFFQHQVAMPIDMAAHGHSPATFGLVTALNGALVVLLQPLAGRAVARLDPSRALAVAGVLTGAGFGLYAVTTSAAGYAAGVVLWTVGEIFGLPVAAALVASLAPAHARGRYQGAYTSTFGLAAFAAPGAGAWALRHLGAPAVWLGCLGIGLVFAAAQLASGPARRERLGSR